MSSWQTGPDWLNANEWTAYPFTEGNAVSDYIIDAQIAVLDADLEGWVLFFTKVTGAGVLSLVARNESDEEVLLSDAVVVSTTYGGYTLWTATSNRVEVSLLIKPFLGSWDSQDWEVVPDAVTYSNDRQLLSLAVYDPSTGITTEVSGPGDPFNLEEGDNTSFAVDEGDGVLRVTVSAVYNQVVPCVPGEWRSGGILTSLNGVTPNKRGEARLSGGDCYAIVLVDGNTIGLRNLCEACCDCPDYEALFNLIKEVHQWLEQSHSDYQDVRTDSKDFVLRVQSIFNTTIVKPEDP